MDQNHKLLITTSEGESVYRKEDQGDWAFAQLEYTFSPHWHVAVLDQYNYGNSEPSKRIHYGLVSAGFINGLTDFLRYGKQRGGGFVLAEYVERQSASTD